MLPPFKCVGNTSLLAPRCRDWRLSYAFLILEVQHRGSKLHLFLPYCSKTSALRAQAPLDQPNACGL